MRATSHFEAEVVEGSLLIDPSRACFKGQHLLALFILLPFMLLQEKMVPIDDHKLMCLAGEPGDRVQFSEFIIANVKLYALRNDRKLSTHAVAHFTRRELATALRRVRTLRPAC